MTIRKILVRAAAVAALAAGAFCLATVPANAENGGYPGSGGFAPTEVRGAPGSGSFAPTEVTGAPGGGSFVPAEVNGAPGSGG